MSRGESGFSQPDSMSMRHQASAQTQMSDADHELLATISSSIYRLRVLGREYSRQMKGKGKGKEKEIQLGEEPWRCMTQAADLLKRSPALKDLLEADQVIQGPVSRLSRSCLVRAD